VKRTLNGVTTYYIYDGEKPILEYNSTGGLAGWNLYGKAIDEILLRVDVANNWTLYFQQDHEGSVTHLTNANGSVIATYRYDAFGAPTFYDYTGTQVSTSPFNNRFLFTGREYAATFSFYAYRARAYNPTLGRFMSEDPKGFVRRIGLGAASSDWSFSGHPDEGEYNLYRYCGNDPLDFTDPMGLDIYGTVTYDYDGDPHAYAVPGSRNIGHDSLRNAMHSSGPLKGQLSENVIVFKGGKPVEKNGYYVSATSWQKGGRYVNADRVPYIALGTKQQEGEGAKGTTKVRAWFRVENPANGKSINIVFADSRGDRNQGIEISPAAARAIGLGSRDQARAVFLGNFKTAFPVDYKPIPRPVFSQ
jgi:RHS repeat-associated protein